MVQEVVVARRTQFSSCDECRRSRVACDASARGITDTAPGDGEPSASCSRCLKRQKPCTFKWVRENKAAASKRTSAAKRRTRRRRGSSPAGETLESTLHDRSSEGTAPLDANKSPPTADWSSPASTVNRDRAFGSVLSLDILSEAATSPMCAEPVPVTADFLSPMQSVWLSTIYRMGFDTVFGSWMGRYSCPFVNAGKDSTADNYVCISNLCEQLDHCMLNDMSNDTDQSNGTDLSQKHSELDRQVDKSMRSTIAAFSARWLPLVSDVVDKEVSESSSIQALWRHARRDMLRVINRPSYRSMLSLFLFALTPIPTGITEEEESDGISGQSCVHAALQHIQILRARQRNLQFSGSKVSTFSKRQTMPTSPDSIGTSDFINAESTAYWAALTFDTSASLTLNCRSLLSSGLFGFDAELSWRLVRTSAKMLDETAKTWQQGSTDMTDERANQIIATGAAWKLLGWKLTAVFKEALRDGHDESQVRKAHTAVVESIAGFNGTFRSLLETCERRMLFLGQQTKLRWFSLMLHYHLSILMFFDIIEATDRFDLLVGLEETRSDAENAVMNTLVFGLHNTYTLTTKPTIQAGDNTQDVGDATKLSVTVPLISIDPYPHHVVAGVQLMRRAIDRDYRLSKLPEESYASLQNTLERTLSHLPQSSKSVQAARTQLSSTKVPGEAVLPHQDPYRVLQTHFAD